jgi:hypothetical protein
MQESANYSQTSPHTLSIRTTPDGFSFCYSTAKGKMFKALKIPTKFDFPERFEDFVQMRGWTDRPSLPVTAIDFSDHFMLLPAEGCQEEHIKSFFNFQFQHDEENQIYTVPLCDGEQLFCWEIPSSRDRAFEKIFPQITMLSSAYLLTNWVIRQASMIHKPVMVAHLYEKTMQIFAADPKRLLFANTFTIKDFQEIPYYFLRCMDQVALDPIQTQCIFCPESVSEQDIIETFSPYIKHIQLAAFTIQINEPLEMIDY